MGYLLLNNSQENNIISMDTAHLLSEALARVVRLAYCLWCQLRNLCQTLVEGNTNLLTQVMNLLPFVVLKAMLLVNSASPVSSQVLKIEIQTTLTQVKLIVWGSVYDLTCRICRICAKYNNYNKYFQTKARKIRGQ